MPLLFESAELSVSWIAPHQCGASAASVSDISAVRNRLKDDLEHAANLVADLVGTDALSIGRLIAWSARSLIATASSMSSTNTLGRCSAIHLSRKLTPRVLIAA